MRLIGKAFAILGAVIFFLGIFWIRGPAVTLSDYGYALLVLIVGALIVIVGSIIAGKPDQNAKKTEEAADGPT
jgi:uncharacterized membrane protein YiaA